MGTRFVVLIGSVMVASLAGCTTHTYDRDRSSAPPATVIHEEAAPSSSAAREGAREGARQGVRDTTAY